MEAYPLSWPVAVPRTPPSKRRRAAFGKMGGSGLWQSRKPLTVAQAIKRLSGEIDRYTKTGRVWRVPPGSVVISTNVRTRLDGLPYSNAREPDDPGVCVYFELDGTPIALPCDTFDRVADNIAAIAGHIAADRAQERYGVGTSAQRYAGFTALPGRGETTGNAWWDLLGLEPGIATQEDVRRSFKAKAKTAHPDAGGSRAEWDALQCAYEQALQATGGNHG